MKILVKICYLEKIQILMLYESRIQNCESNKLKSKRNRGFTLWNFRTSSEQVILLTITMLKKARVRTKNLVMVRWLSELSYKYDFKS